MLSTLEPLDLGGLSKGSNLPVPAGLEGLSAQPCLGQSNTRTVFTVPLGGVRWFVGDPSLEVNDLSV